MIITFSLFTFVKGEKEDGVHLLHEYVDMGGKFGMTNAHIAESIGNEDQCSVVGYFETKEQWQAFDEKLQSCEVEGNCFLDLMPLLERPPKLYSFEEIK